MKTIKRLTALLLASAATLTGNAVAGQATVIHAGRMVDVDAGTVLADRAIHIEDGRIVRVEPWSANAAKDAKLIDWSQYTVLPGLMDMHTHIADEIQAKDPGLPLKSTPARDAFIGAKNAWDTVRAGFTTVRDVGTYRAYVDVALRDAINAGWVEGPRMFVAGAYVTVPGGGGEVTGTGMAVPDLNWYFSYNLFRLAGITQGIAGRIRDGTAANAKAIESAKRTVPLSQASWEYAQKAGAV